MIGPVFCFIRRKNGFAVNIPCLIAFQKTHKILCCLRCGAVFKRPVTYAKYKYLENQVW